MTLIHALSTAAPLYWLVLLRLVFPRLSGLQRPIPVEDTLLLAITVVFAALSLCQLGMSYYLPSRMVREQARRGQAPEDSVKKALMFRTSLYAAIGIFGLALGFLGAAWATYLPFFLVSLVALLLTFPNEERVKALLEQARS